MSSCSEDFYGPPSPKSMSDCQGIWSDLSDMIFLMEGSNTLRLTLPTATQKQVCLSHYTSKMPPARAAWDGATPPSSCVSPQLGFPSCV